MTAEKSVLVPLDPDETFALLTEPERLRRWQAVTARVELRAGGQYRWTINPGHTASGTITEVEPGRRIVFTWGWEDSDDLPPGASTVTILWQAGEHIGATLVGEPGTLIWNELLTDNGEAAYAFYGDVLGLTTEVSDMGGNPYTLFKAGGEMVAGSMPPPVEGILNHWHVYFAVEAMDAALDKARQLGAKVVMGPMPTPIGPMATLSDPQGAIFSLFEPSGETP